MFVCGFIILFYLCPFETKRGSNFYFGTGYILLHRLYVFVPEWPKGEFTGFIGYILVDKNTSFSGTPNSKSISDIIA
jgi:hypothetical protein